MSTKPARREPHRILIIKPSSLGDVVHALPVLAALRERYPQAHVAWLIAKPFAPLLDGHALIDELVIFDRRRYGRMLGDFGILREFVRFVWELRRRRFDLVIDLQGLVRSGFFTFASGAPRRVGFARAREFAWAGYTQRVRCESRDQHAVEKNLCVAGALDLPHRPARFPLGLQDHELAAARELLRTAAGREMGEFVALLPGARWETKRWMPTRFAAVLDQLHQQGYPPAVLLGGPNEREFADQICAQTASAPIDLVGQTTLRELAAVLSLSVLVICQDSGPMHIGAALNKPLVALFGPTNPDRTGPYCETAQIVQRSLPCVPCYRRQCPLSHHKCLRELGVEEVLEAVREQVRLGLVRPPTGVAAVSSKPAR